MNCKKNNLKIDLGIKLIMKVHIHVIGVNQGTTYPMDWMIGRFVMICKQFVVMFVENIVVYSKTKYELQSK